MHLCITSTFFAIFRFNKNSFFSFSHIKTQIKQFALNASFLWLRVEHFQVDKENAPTLPQTKDSEERGENSFFHPLFPPLCSRYFPRVLYISLVGKYTFFVDPVLSNFFSAKAS